MTTQHEQRSEDRPLDRVPTMPTTGAARSTRTRAAGITAFGEPLATLEVPVPDAGPGQIQIRVTAAGAGLWDVEEATGMVDVPLPKALGWQGSGIVEQVGPDTPDLSPGDAVVAYMPMAGFYAERVTVPATMAVPAPTSIPLAEAGGLLIGAATAYQALVDVAELRAGQTVLVTAAAGGTGAFAVELAKHLGAHVLATASPSNHPFLRALGADEVLDYHDPDVLDRLRRLQPDGIDVLLDNVSSDNFTRYAPLVRSGGVALGTHEPHPPAPDGVTGALIASWERPTSFARVVELVDEGVLHVRVRERVPLDEAERAHDVLRTHHGRGAVLIVP
jgi:NADPH:quinone reductase-like Zn-dependent oxidoreductase